MKEVLYFVYGDDDYLVEAEARAWLNQRVPEAERDMGIEIIDGRKTLADETLQAVAACMDSVQTPSFFGSTKATWFRNVNFLTGGADRRLSESEGAKAAVEKLTKWLKGGLLDGQNLVITAPKALRSSVFFKTCVAQGKVKDFGSGLKAYQLDKNARGNIETLLSQAQLQMKAGAISELLNRVGPDTRTLASEIEKLRVYVHPGTEATSQDVRDICSIGRETEAWEILDSFGQRDALSLMETLARLGGQKGIGIMLATMLERNVRELLVLREAYDRKWVTARGWSDNLTSTEADLLASLPVNSSNMPAWMLRKRLPYALNYTLPELRRARRLVLELREKLVSSGLPEMLLLETTLLRIVGPGRAQARPSGVRTGAR